jgi:predicted methyltransferase
MRIIVVLLAAAGLTACQPAEQEQLTASEDTAPQAPAPTSSGTGLVDILAAQPEKVQARYVYRHPQATLEFFEVEPGMIVFEALPGGGWYSKVLVPYLGSDGKLIGADYSIEMFPLFGFFDDEFVEKRKSWVADWSAEASQWQADSGASIAAFVFGSMPDTLEGSADRVLFIRALHNLARFEDQGGFLTAAIADAYRALKPGGIVGVVQHRARDDKTNEFAAGDHGYLKQDFVIERMEAAGFEFVGASNINANPNDQPADDDVVWRLPPSLRDSKDNPEAKAAMEAIGESNRMTLKFRKPE